MNDKEQEIQNERYLASIANYLAKTDREDYAKLIAQSSLVEIEETDTRWDAEGMPYEAVIGSQYELRVPPELYQAIQNSNWVEDGLREVIVGVMGKVNCEFRLETVEYDVNWRMRLVAEADTQEVTNQNNLGKEPIMFQGMRFSSPPEVEIAKALEHKGVMYFPNCLVRVGTKDNRQTRFPDFLVHHLGKWGILEVDGQTYHSGGQSATKDHERTQLMQLHGKIYFARYAAQRCKKEPAVVVAEFLKLLDMNG